MARRSLRVDVGTDISIPIRTSLYATISSDPQGRNPLTTKTVQIEINYKSPQTPGYVGSNGYNTSSVIGPRGYTGSQGAAGSIGAIGYAGSVGQSGGPGFTGSQGLTGLVGSPGLTGTPGQTGPQGLAGPPGAQGYIGSQGEMGQTGPAGLSGFPGFTGSTGPTGYTGSQGDAGTRGVTGVLGNASKTYKTIKISDQVSVSANQPDAVLTLVAGTGINLATGASGITITNSINISGANTQILWSSGTGNVSSNAGLTFNNQTLAVIGNITATGEIISSFSDHRLKTPQGQIAHSLDKIKSIQGFYYKYNDIASDLGISDKNIHLGVSAQEVAQVLPEIVCSGTGEFLTVIYERLVPVLVEAIKTQTQEIERLEQKLSILVEKYEKTRRA